jgi:nanoRNase/pAp phosphatase (c-di-AMP/oligoRNAs hydrolase)
MEVLTMSLVTTVKALLEEGEVQLLEAEDKLYEVKKTLGACAYEIEYEQQRDSIKHRQTVVTALRAIVERRRDDVKKAEALMATP